MEIPAVIPSVPLFPRSVNSADDDDDDNPIPVPMNQIETFFSRTTNLASSALNATVLAQSDEYFACASNLLTPTAPIHRPGVFVHTGAWYDGWETRRHNPEPYDWV